MSLLIIEKKKSASYLAATIFLSGITTVASLVYTTVLLYKNLPGLEKAKKLHLITAGVILASLVVAISSLLSTAIIEVTKENPAPGRDWQPENTSIVLIVIGAAALVVGLAAFAANTIGQIPIFAKAVHASPTPLMITGLVLACLPIFMTVISLLGWGIGTQLEETTVPPRGHSI